MLRHRPDTVKGRHRKPSAKSAAKSVTFDSASYLEGLMAELDRAGISIRMGQSRDEAGLKQPQIADMLEVHFRTVQDWESPKMRVVPFDRLDEWARLTKTTREWLLYGEEAQRDDRLAAIEEEIRLVRAELAAVRETLPVVDQVLELARDLQAQLQARADTG